MFKSFSNTTLVSFILIIIITMIISIFSSTPIILSEEYYSQYDIDTSLISSNLIRILLAVTR